MPYNEHLADRVRQVIAPHKSSIEEKKMFGGLAFMYKGKMSCGIVKEDLMVRCIETRMDEALAKPHCRKMDFTGRPMKGFLFVSPDGLDTDAEIEEWIKLGIEFVESKL